MLSSEQKHGPQTAQLLAEKRLAAMRKFLRAYPEPACGQTLTFAVFILGYDEFAGMTDAAFRALHAKVRREIYPPDEQAAAA